MLVRRETIIDAQVKELRAIAEEVRQHPGEPLNTILSRRPPWVGWVDENGQARESPRMTVNGGLSDNNALKA